MPIKYSLTFLTVFATLFLLDFSNAFRNRHFAYRQHGALISNTAVFYDYFKKGPEKKEIGRLWKNIIFPGIYVEYADTKEPKKTIKIETKDKRPDVRNEGVVNQPSTVGTYQTLDPTYTVTYESSVALKNAELKPPTKPTNFVAPLPKKSTDLNNNRNIIQCLPNVGKFPRPKKPIVIYEFETDTQCRQVREACTLLDLIVEYRPCPGARSGFSDFMASVTSGKRTLPFMQDGNPSMYK